MPRRKLLKWTKWTCTLAAGAAVALAVLSRFCWCQYAVATASGDTEWHAKAGSGLVSLTRYDGLLIQNSGSPVAWTTGTSHDWYWGSSGEANPSFPFGVWRAGLCCGRRFNVVSVGASLLYPVALTLAAAGLFWYADRPRLGPGSCSSCGYDRAGLPATTKCPECGKIPDAS